MTLVMTERFLILRQARNMMKQYVATIEKDTVNGEKGNYQAWNAEIDRAKHIITLQDKELTALRQ